MNVYNNDLAVLGLSSLDRNFIVQVQKRPESLNLKLSIKHKEIVVTIPNKIASIAIVRSQYYKLLLHIVREGNLIYEKPGFLSLLKKYFFYLGYLRYPETQKSVVDPIGAFVTLIKFIKAVELLKEKNVSNFLLQRFKEITEQGSIDPYTSIFEIESFYEHQRASVSNEKNNAEALETILEFSSHFVTNKHFFYTAEMHRDVYHEVLTDFWVNYIKTSAQPFLLFITYDENKNEMIVKADRSELYLSETNSLLDQLHVHLQDKHSTQLKKLSNESLAEHRAKFLVKDFFLQDIEKKLNEVVIHLTDRYEATEVNSVCKHLFYVVVKEILAYGNISSKEIVEYTTNAFLLRNLTREHIKGLASFENSLRKREQLLKNKYNYRKIFDWETYEDVDCLGKDIAKHFASIIELLTQKNVWEHSVALNYPQGLCSQKLCKKDLFILDHIVSLFDIINSHFALPSHEVVQLLYKIEDGITKEQSNLRPIFQ